MTEELDFEINPRNHSIRVNRDLALISLHSDFTSYLETIDERVRPVELPIMGYYEHGGKYSFYDLNEGWYDDLWNFSNVFEMKYPEVEQVYVFSRFNAHNDYKESVSKDLSKCLSSIIFKRFLIIPFASDIGASHYYRDQASSDEDIKRIVEKSLRFSSW